MIMVGFIWCLMFHSKEVSANLVVCDTYLDECFSFTGRLGLA